MAKGEGFRENARGRDVRWIKGWGERATSMKNTKRGRRATSLSSERDYKENL